MENKMENKDVWVEEVFSSVKNRQLLSNNGFADSVMHKLKADLLNKREYNSLMRKMAIAAMLLFVFNVTSLIHHKHQQTLSANNIEDDLTNDYSSLFVY